MLASARARTCGRVALQSPRLALSWNTSKRLSVTKIPVTMMVGFRLFEEGDGTPPPLRRPGSSSHPLGGGCLTLQPLTLNLSEFVVGRSWSVGRGVHRNEAPLFSRNWLENGEETCSSIASVDALQTAIN